MKIKIFPPSENVKYLKKIHELFRGLDLFQLFSSPLWCVKKRDAREIPSFDKYVHLPLD